MKNTPCILIVDDVNTNIRILQKAVQEFGEIVGATSGQQALELFEEKRPDLVLLDLMMPEMDGYEVLDRMRQISGDDLPPVIFVTARDDQESETTALSHGAVDFINKPVNPTVVKSRVRVHLDLARRSSQLKALNDSLESMVEARTDALRIALERAESATRSQSQFLRNVSHELLTPLNAILGFANLLRIKRANDADLNTRLQPILESAYHLKDMINQLLQIAGQDSTTQNAEPFRLSGLLKSMEKHGRDSAAKAGLAFKYEAATDLPDVVIGMPDNVRQILQHLIDNAVKFSDSGTITMRASATDKEPGRINLRLEVIDQGIGIDPTAREHVFALFEQADSTSTRRHGGLGIGLPTCQFLAQQMDAEIHFESESGKGSHFWLDVEVGLQVDAAA